MAFFDKIKQGLAKTKANIDSALNSVFAVFREVDEDLLEELLAVEVDEAVLVTAEAAGDPVEDDADARVVQGLDHLLVFIDTDFTVKRIGGVAALGNIVVLRIVAPGVGIAVVRSKLFNPKSYPATRRYFCHSSPAPTPI